MPDWNFIREKDQPDKFGMKFQTTSKTITDSSPSRSLSKFWSTTGRLNRTSRLIKIWSRSILTDARPCVGARSLGCEWLLFGKGYRGYGGLLNRAALSWQRVIERQRKKERDRRGRKNDRTCARDRRRSAMKTSDSQEMKDSTRQIKRDASRQEVGGEDRADRQDCSIGWFQGMDTQSLRPR